MSFWGKVKAKLYELYNIPLVHNLLVALEGGVVAGICDAGIEPTEIFTKHGASHLWSSVLAGVVLSLRMFWRNNLQARAALAELKAQGLRTQADAQTEAAKAKNA